MTRKNTVVAKTIAVFFLVSGKARPVSFCNRIVSRASFRDAPSDVPAYISPYGAVAHFYILHYPPVLFSPHLFPPYSIPEARLFSLQSSIVGCQPCQVPLALAAGKSSSPTRRRAYFPRLPCPGLPPILRAEK